VIKKWQRYQQKAAAYFRALGLTVEIEAKIKGARGLHKIDVFVTGEIGTLPVRWIIECKLWNRSISKEKVLVLQQVVQDLGADRGILLSEAGFQSGAVLASENSNITLSSLKDLTNQTDKKIVSQIVERIHWRIHRVGIRLSRIHRIQKEDERYWNMTPAMVEKGKITMIAGALEDALEGKFPTIYGYGKKTDERILAHSLGVLIFESSKLISKAEAYVNKMEKVMNMNSETYLVY